MISTSEEIVDLSRFAALQTVPKRVVIVQTLAESRNVHFLNAAIKVFFATHQKTKPDYTYFVLYQACYHNYIVSKSFLHSFNVICVHINALYSKSTYCILKKRPCENV